MSRENGESRRTLASRGPGRPLSPHQRTVAPLAQRRPGRPRLDEDASLDRPAAPPASSRPSGCSGRAPTSPSGGWRRAVFIALRRTRRDRAEPGRAAPARARRAGSRRRSPGCRKVAFISRKGGVGKTTTCLLAGHTFATHRGDRVDRGRRQPGRRHARPPRPARDDREPHVAPRATPARIERYADIRGYTSQAPTRLEVVAADDDPRITQAIGESEFQPGDPSCSSATTTSSASTPGPACSNRRRAGSSTRPIRSSSSARRASTARAPRARRSTGSTRTATTTSSRSPSPCSTRCGRTPGVVDLDRIEEHFASALPRLRPHPVGSAPRGRGRGDRSTSFSPTTRGAYLELAAAIGVRLRRHDRKEVIAMIARLDARHRRHGHRRQAGPERPARKRGARVADLGPRVLGAARRARRAAHLGRRLGALVSLRATTTTRRSAGGARSSPPSPRSSSARRPRSSRSSRTSARRSSRRCPAATSASDGVLRRRLGQARRRARDSGARAARDRHRDRQPHRRAPRRHRRSCRPRSTVPSSAPTPRPTGSRAANADARGRGRRRGARRSPPSTATSCSTRAGSARSSRGSPQPSRGVQLIAAFEQASAQTRAKLGAGTVPRAGDRASRGPGRLPGRALLAQRRRRSRSGTSASSAAARRSSRSSRGGPRSSRSSGSAAPGRSARSRAPTGRRLRSPPRRSPPPRVELFAAIPRFEEFSVPSPERRSLSRWRARRSRCSCARSSWPARSPPPPAPQHAVRPEPVRPPGRRQRLRRRRERREQRRVGGRRLRHARRDRVGDGRRRLGDRQGRRSRRQHRRAPISRASWFQGQYGAMLAVAGALALLMLMLAVIQAVHAAGRLDARSAPRSATCRWRSSSPAVAIAATGLLVAITDDISARRRERPRQRAVEQPAAVGRRRVQERARRRARASRCSASSSARSSSRSERSSSGSR